MPATRSQGIPSASGSPGARFRPVGLLGAALAVWMALGALGVYFMDRRFIFFPDPDLIATPETYGLPFEDVTLTTGDGVAVHGWFIPAPSPQTDAGRPPFTFLMLHGNAGNISGRIDWAKRFRDRLGVNVFLLDYRGYGRSEGEPSERGTYLDGEAAMDALEARPDVDGDRLILAGHSLGAAVALELALRRPPAGLVLESPFTSVSDMAKQVIPFLPLGLFLSTRYENLGKISRLRCPLLVMHGEEDEVIPFEQGVRLFEAAPQPKTFFRIRHAGHNDTYLAGGEAYIQAYVRFLASLDHTAAAPPPRIDGPVPVGAK